MNYNHDKYPMIIGAKYLYSSREGAANKSFDKMIGTLERVELSKKEIELRINETLFYWIGNYESFTFYWKLIK